MCFIRYDTTVPFPPRQWRVLSARVHLGMCRGGLRQSARVHFAECTGVLRQVHGWTSPSARLDFAKCMGALRLPHSANTSPTFAGSLPELSNVATIPRGRTTSLASRRIVTDLNRIGVTAHRNDAAKAVVFGRDGEGHTCDPASAKSPRRNEPPSHHHRNWH